MIRRLLCAATAMALSACATDAVKPADPPTVVNLPETVTRVVREYVAVPEELLRDCYDENAKEQTNAEALRLALLRKESLAACTADKHKIRALSGKAVKP